MFISHFIDKIWLPYFKMMMMTMMMMVTKMVMVMMMVRAKAGW